MIAGLVVLLTIALLSGTGAADDEPPVVPVGLDAYRMWDKWAYQRIGVRAYMRSTYDRTGGNRSADASHFLYQLSDDFNVTLDTVGPGVLYFARYNHWHGSPWHYEVDGVDHIVKESSTADPTKPVEGSVFLPQDLFPNPLTWTWATTKGADLMWVPIPFEDSFRMAYTRTRYGTGYYIYHLFDPGANLSQPIKSWDWKTPPSKDVLDLLGRSGSDPDPVTRVTGTAQTTTIPKGKTLTLIELTEGPGMIRELQFSAPKEHAVALSQVRLKITWDGREHPSVDAPLALFFGAGTFYNRDDKEYLVKGFPMNVRFDAERIHLACYFPMPFFKSAKIELEGIGTADIPDVRWRVRSEPLNASPNHVGYFHATYRDHPMPEPGKDMVFLDTTKVEGGGDWSGSFVGTSFIFTHRGVLNTLEGDPRFFFDDSRTPQAQGTGSEEWGGGGDYWGGRTMTLPLAGHPVGVVNPKDAKCEEDLIHSEYRFLLADLFPFGKNARIQFEHGAVNDSKEHYKSVVYWYGLPSPSLIKTDEIDIGDLKSEKAHDYHSPNASAPGEVTSRYEWGPDTMLVSEAGPLADPADYAEFEFEAKAGISYYMWVRGKNLDNSMTSDSFWMQFDGDIGTANVGASYRNQYGFGNWLDEFPPDTYAWSGGRPQDAPLTITFDRPGKHRLRIQTRHGKHYLDQIWLSPTEKGLPSSAEPRAKRAGEIVLSAADIVRKAGNIVVADDPMASGGKAIVMDVPAGQEIFPAETDIGRVTKGASEFTLRLVPENHGVLLRRKLDYSYPNQRAEVYVSEVDRSDWKHAGTWYLAGSNTCVYSDAKGELGTTEHNVIESNRRFRDDEFIIPKALTRGKSEIRVRVKFVPVETPLFPGHPLPELAWSEMRYTAYCWVIPRWENTGVRSQESEGDEVLIPQIDGPWWTIAGDPDLGELTGEKQQPVDFAVWQAADGSWQLWSCIRGTKCGGNTRLFYRWEGKSLTESNWKPMGIVMQADPKLGEAPGGMQAPHVIHQDGRFHMFYGDWEHICLADSKDGKTFERRIRPDGKTGMFTEGIGNNTRDAMVIRIGDRWHCYYTAFPDGKGAVYCRTSTDMVNWSESKVVAFGGQAGTGPFSSECPFVQKHKGWYYLFRTQRYGQDAQTSVYRSKDPMDFGVEDDRYLVGRLPVAAPEIIEHQGKHYIACLLPSLKGIRIARLNWVPKMD